MTNQYFRWVFRDGQAFLHFYPPTDGGEHININEVTAYLELKGYQTYDVKALGAALRDSLEKELEVLVAPWNGIEVSETMDVNVSLDKMKVTCRFYPASAGGRTLSAKEIVDTLVLRKVKFGIDQQAVADFLQKKEYCKDYVFATGLAPVHGRDASITYFFNTNINLQPKRNEDGSVDYKELNTISHIRTGDLLARLTPADPGKSGRNVFGEEIRPRNVRTKVLSFGKNIRLSEDGLEIYSEVTGHVSLTNEKVFVSDVYEVPADVDNSTGNIEYDGSVHVRGNIRTGFRVRATGDIVVEGAIEGAEVYSDSQVIVKQGVHGMYKGKIHAGSNVLARYIENATVEAGGYVEAEIILNSDISANSTVRSKGRKGLINGGIVRAGNSVEADNIGTEMGNITTIEVGVEPERKARYIELSKKFKEMDKDLEDTKLILSNYSIKLKKGERLPQDKMLYVQKLAAQFKQQQAQIEPIREEMTQIHREMMISDRSFVEVSRKIFPGAVISISDLTLNIHEERSHCRYKKQNGEIRALPL